MSQRGKNKLRKVGQTCLFYGEVVGFVAAWAIALWVVVRQPATPQASSGPNQFAAATDTRALGGTPR
jgi:hypothetical protein